MQRWADVEDVLVGLAEIDLRGCGEIRPTLMAAEGEEPLLVAVLRPFERGGYQSPIIELLALACPLGADRLALGIGGRAWSLDDPLPPVVDGVGDLRQRVLCLELTQAGGPHRSVLRPFDMADGAVCWHEPLEQPGQDGWIGAVLRMAVTEGHTMAASARELRRQARRCVRLGHQLSFTPQTLERLGECSRR